MWVGIVTLSASLACSGWDDATFGSAPTASRSTPASISSPIISPGTPTRDVTLRWLPSPSAGVIRYDLAVGQSSGSYASVVRIPVSLATRAPDGVLSYPISVRSDVDVYLALRAVDFVQTSPLSNEIRVVAVSSPAPNLGANGLPETSSNTAATSTSLMGGGGSGQVAIGAGAFERLAGAPDAGFGNESIDPTTDASNDDESSSILASLEFDGFGEYLANTSPADFDAAAPFSLSMWLQPTLDRAARRVLFDARAERGSISDRVSLSLLEGEVLEWVVQGADGEVVMRARYEFAATAGEWQQLAVVFDPGFDLEPRLYLDLEACPLLAVEPEDAVFEPQPSRFVAIGGATDAQGEGFVGRIGHVAIWDAVLPWAGLEVVQRSGHAIDLRLATDAYSSAGSLSHYWRLGDLDEAIGYDLGRSAAALDLDDAAGAIAYDDVVLDGPAAIVAAAPNP
jgi:hypothetical protein